MKKYLALLLIPLCLLFCACDGTKKVNDSSENKLNESKYFENSLIEDEIKSKYLEIYLIDKRPQTTEADVTIDKFYGKYGDSYVVRISDNYYRYVCAATRDTINDLIFSYPDGNSVKVFNGSRFYNLKEAYLNSIMTRENLQELHKLFPQNPDCGSELHGAPIADNWGLD